MSDICLFYNKIVNIAYMKGLIKTLIKHVWKIDYVNKCTLFEISCNIRIKVSGDKG